MLAENDGGENMKKEQENADAAEGVPPPSGLYPVSELLVSWNKGLH